MSAVAGLLTDAPFLAEAGEEARAAFQRIAVVREYPKGNILFYDGEPCDAVHGVLDGRVKISLISEEGREVTLAIVRPGGFFGLVAALDPRRLHIGTATTITGCSLAKVPTAAFVDWLCRYPSVQRPLLGELARLMGDAYRKIGRQALMPVKQRLLSALVDIASSDGEPADDGDVVFTRPTHQELADLVGTTRVVVSRLLKELLVEEHALASSGKVMRVSISKVLQETEL